MGRNESSIINTLLGTWTPLKIKNFKNGEWEERDIKETDEIITFMIEEDSIHFYLNGIIDDSSPVLIDEENELFKDLNRDEIFKISSYSYDFFELLNEDTHLIMKRVYPDNYENNW